MNKRDLIDALTFDVKLNPLINLRKLELLENKKYYEEVFLPTAWLGRPFNNEFISYCFFGETYFNFALTLLVSNKNIVVLLFADISLMGGKLVGISHCFSLLSPHAIAVPSSFKATE